MSGLLSGGTLLRPLALAIVLAAQAFVQPSSAQAPSQSPPAPGQSKPAGEQAQQPVFRTGINFVRVDVIVTDRDGNPVSDLTQADFDVLEDGKPQTVEMFRVVRLGGTPAPGGEPARPIRSAYDEEAEAARDDVRLFAVFLDDYHVRLGSSMAVRDPLMNFISNQLGPNDMIGLMYPLTPIEDVRLTRDHAAAARAIRSFQGRKYDYTPRNTFEDRYAMYPAEVVERIRNQVSLSALRSLVTHLGGLREGRKAVILVSEGYTDLLPPQLRDPIASVPGLGNPNRGNPFAGQGSLTEERARFLADLDLQQELREVYDAANRANTAIYALDPRGLAAAEFSINEGVGATTDSRVLNSTLDTLRTLADQTDGRAIVNRNDLEAGLRQVVRDTSAYYLLGYTTQSPSDGKFHKIEVRLKTRRPGYQVRARRGFWALTREETARALTPRPVTPPAVERALASIAKPRRRLIQTWIGTSRGEDGRMRVTFVWEPAPAGPGARRDEPVRVVVLAAGAEGSPYFRGTVPGDGAPGVSEPGNAGTPKIGSGAPATTLRPPQHVSFHADPGRMELRLQIEGSEGVLDTDVQEITVPDLSRPEVAFSTPRVLRARNAVEYRGIMAASDPVPTALREFRRTDRLLIRFAVYGPGTEIPAVSGQLLNRGGKPMSPLTVSPHAGPDATHQIDLPLASLPPGEYLVELKARTDADEATELIPIRVGA